MEENKALASDEELRWSKTFCLFNSEQKHDNLTLQVILSRQPPTWNPQDE